jgi:hypothetical protein
MPMLTLEFEGQLAEVGEFRRGKSGAVWATPNGDLFVPIDDDGLRKIVRPPPEGLQAFKEDVKVRIVVEILEVNPHRGSFKVTT